MRLTRVARVEAKYARVADHDHVALDVGLGDLLAGQLRQQPRGQRRDFADALVSEAGDILGRLPEELERVGDLNTLRARGVGGRGQSLGQPLVPHPQQ